MIKHLKNWLALRRKKKELKAVEHWIWELEDQKTSAEAGLKKAYLQKAKLEGEIGPLMPPDELVRLMGVA